MISKAGRKFFAGALLALVIGGCASATSGVRETSRASSPEADRASILAQSRRLSAAYVRGDIEALVEVYSDSGVAAPAGREFVRGHAALRRLWALPPNRKVLRHASMPESLVIDGDHAYDWGHYEGQVTVDGVPVPPFRGTYTIIWQRGRDGVWRIAMDMWAALRNDDPGS